MAGILLNFRASARKPRDWTNQELADLFRVAQILTDAGLRVDTDHGLTDEGDPWFVFFRPDTEEVIVHFARLDGLFLACSASGGTFTGPDFRTTINQALQNQPMVLPARPQGGNVLYHPNMLLAAFVAAAWMFLEGINGSEARAATPDTPDGDQKGDAPAARPASASGLPGVLMTRVSDSAKASDLTTGLSPAQVATIGSVLASVSYLLTTPEAAVAEDDVATPPPPPAPDSEAVTAVTAHSEAPLLAFAADHATTRTTAFGLDALAASGPEQARGFANLFLDHAALPSAGDALPSAPTLLRPVVADAMIVDGKMQIETVRFDPRDLDWVETQ